MNNVEVCPDAKHSVTNVCKECKSSFVATRVAIHCSSACKQAAYRKSPAYKESLANKKARRLRRRNAYFKRKNRFKSFGLDCYSGPIATDVPRLGMLDLKNY
jgi:hypothetical protein